MVDLGISPPSQFPSTLRTKLVLSTATILIIACLLMGCLFIQQQVRSAAESLVQSGALLAQHLAEMGRYSIVAGDSHRLNQLIREILAVKPVAYVAVVSSSGELQAGSGKAPWDQQFSPQATDQRRFSVTHLVHPRDPALSTTEPLVTAIILNHNGPVSRETIEFTPGELIRLIGGAQLPVYYDITVQVPHHSPITLWDPALQLTFEERMNGLEESSASKKFAPTLVQVGLSTSNLQHELRQLLWQAVMITMSTLTGGLCIVVLLARRITIPLQSLTIAATQLAAGKAVPAVAIHAHDEIGTLTRVFDGMSAALQSREHELRELAHTLEHRVEARTEELAAANTKLQELDRRKSIFVSTASHELRTPLTSMKVHLANLRDGIDGAVTDDQRRSLSRVEANLSRLQTLIDDLLDLSRIELGQSTLQFEPLRLESLIAKAVEDLGPVASEREVRILLSLPTDLPPVCADPDKLHQIVLNLLHNAVKFSPSHTTIDVSVSTASMDQIQVSIQDVGPGIAAKDVEKIFEPFYQVSTTGKKAKGAGLGLAIAKLLVELHHGRIWVETQPGQGSCFSFTLPLSPSASLPAADTRVGAHSQHYM